MPEKTPKKSNDHKNIDFDNIITQSQNMIEVLDTAKEIAQSDINILVTGETGCGKELVACAIHNNSPRKDGPYVVINCAGIPDTLLESELFGHEKGAFTDASDKRRGKFELAHGGTLFLDEIGDLSAVAQPKILRAIEEKRFARVGGEEPIEVDCRIIAATNKDLRKESTEGKFREDLYYRLCEAHLHLPPLRERQDDIALLTDHFIKEFNGQFNKYVHGASDVVKSYLSRYNWPGNVRELKSIIRIGMALIKNNQMWLEDLPFNIRLMSDEPASPTNKSLALDMIEKEHIANVLKIAQWNKVKAAKLLKVSRPTLDRKIAKYDLKP